ncbi:hypothetical protein K8P63_08145 [Sphingomonas nostoxanthinifaciens]|nr:hypothetical protein K8P63_08145 [Sphingomonas nostoxanthinifaciens]
MSTSLAAARDEARAAIGAAAQSTGVDFSYLLAQAQSESGLNATAKAGNSTATGLYQFLDQSWLAVVKKHGAEHGLGWAADAIQSKRGGGFTVDPSLRDAVFGLREQAAPAAMMAASYASENAQGLTQALGRGVNGTDLYFAHFLGLQGATRFLRAATTSPDATAASLFPREAHSNRGIFYASDGSARTLGQVYALMGSKLDKASDANGVSDTSNATPGSLVQSLPGAPPLPDVRLAYADMSDASLGTPATQVADASGDVSSMMAALEQGRVNLLKPTPAQARLAYLMLSATPAV